MLTLDASTGQNAVSQAKLFNEAVGLTGITLTKLDGTAKGGVIFAIADQFGIPIRYIASGKASKICGRLRLTILLRHFLPERINTDDSL